MKLKRLLALALVILSLMGDIALANDYYAKTTSSTTIYKSASSSSSKVTDIESGQWLFVSDIKDGWAKVSYNGKTGYVASHKVKKTAKAVYVKSESAVIYKNDSSSSSKLTTVPYGSKLDAYYKTGDYTKVVYGKYEGFMKTSSITLTNPNTFSKTVYIQAESGNVYATPNTSSSSTSVNGTTALKATALYNDSWYRVTYGSSNKVAFVQKSKVGSEKYTKTNTQKSSSGSSNSSSDHSSSSKTMYVKSASVTLYKSDSTSSSKVGTVVYGCKVTVTAVNDDWCKCSYGSMSGYCKKSALTGSDPNTLSNTVYVKSSSVKIYKTPSTSATSTTISPNTALKQTAKYDSTWSRVTYNGNIGFVKTSDLTTTKGGSVSTSSPANCRSVTVDWFKGNIQSEFYKGRIATVTDVSTKISWKVKRKGGSNHADVEPLTAADTAAMKKACGSDFMTWHRRPIWVSLNGNKYAASMNCMAHGECNIKDNNFDGHFCIHFTNSRTHGTDKVDSDHQNAIKKAYAAG